MPAPVALFVYNRPQHTIRTLKGLTENTLARKSDLIAFADGIRGPEDVAAVAEVRRVLRQITGFASVTVFESPTNRGLAESIITGVASVLAKSPAVIVVEDDLVTSPYFLKFINDGLALYQDDDRVASIHGYAPPTRRPLPSTYFLRGADCWGWGTWRRAWKHFRADAGALLAEVRRRGLEREFNFHGTRRLVKMLSDNADGKNNSWAIRWHASAFLAGMYTLHPGTSLVDNIGFDGSGSHCDTRQDFRFEVAARVVNIQRSAVQEDSAAIAELERFYSTLRRRQVLRKVGACLRQCLPLVGIQI